MTHLTDEMRAQGWVEGPPPGWIKADLLFESGEVSERCDTTLALVAIGPEAIIAYRMEPSQ